MNLLGQVASESTTGPVTVYVSERWPFGARVRVLPEGLVTGDISSGGYTLFTVEPTATTPEAVALQLDAASKSIFSQAAWYQT
jgi:hypothetical protein